MRVQDLYQVSVCGDVYLDGQYLASTSCPAKNGGDTNDYQSDPQKAVDSGNFGYVDVVIPAGTHTISFLETYLGGQAYYRFTSVETCPYSVFSDVVATQTLISSETTTTTTTLDPTFTSVATETSVVTSTPDPNTETSVLVPTTTTTKTPAAVSTSVYQCKTLTVNVRCPGARSASQLDALLLQSLRGYKTLSGGKDVGVTCPNFSGTLYY